MQFIAKENNTTLSNALGRIGRMHERLTAIQLLLITVKKARPKRKQGRHMSTWSLQTERLRKGRLARWNMHDRFPSN
jgi:hypothetical protein